MVLVCQYYHLKKVCQKSWSFEANDHFLITILRIISNSPISVGCVRGVPSSFTTSSRRKVESTWRRSSSTFWSTCSVIPPLLGYLSTRVSSRRLSSMSTNRLEKIFLPMFAIGVAELYQILFVLHRTFGCRFDSYGFNCHAIKKIWNNCHKYLNIWSIFDHLI